MISKLGNKIIISVRTSFNVGKSYPMDGFFLFDYHITIENKSENIVQLLKRQWFIYDSVGERSEVEGEGVVGLQPMLLPNEKFTYQSACHLKSDVGKMHGKYLMQQIDSAQLFEVDIPTFKFIANYRRN